MINIRLCKKTRYNRNSRTGEQLRIVVSVRLFLVHCCIADSKGKYNLRPDLPCMERCVTASDLIMSVLKVAVQVECMISCVRVVTVLLTHVASVPEFFDFLNGLGLLLVQFLNKPRIRFCTITASG